MNYIENVDKLDSESLRDPELYHELMDCESDFDRETAYLSVRERAKSLGLTKQFDMLYQAMKREYAKQAKVERIKNAQVVGSGLTDFDFLDIQYRCGDWAANDEGIVMNTDQGAKVACPHPIVPVRILRNAETGKYKVEIVFKVRNKVRHIFVDREDIASPTKILKLANDSVQITSNGAPLLVQYLSDVERLGSEDGSIVEVTSTSRLGWIDDIDENGNRTKYFLPYEREIVFDNEASMRSLYDSIKHFGSREKWYGIIKDIRAKHQNEVLINLAASFASVLVDVCGMLPFIVSLWGGSGIGKSVILKICTSVWADPGEGKYITDAKATTTAMEMRLNILNSLPMTLDDMAQIQNQEDNFSNLIYRWCAGKGRDRSNKELGLNKLTSWRNCTITNGERSLVDESTQGGAINRVLDIEASGEKIFNAKSGNKTVNIIEKNYGFAGEEFIQVIKDMNPDEIKALVDKYYDAIKEVADQSGVKKEDKQIGPMALILAADELTEKHLFQDGVRLNIEDCCRYLKNQEDSSEGIRAYEYLIGNIMANKYHFEDDPDRAYARWGFFKGNDKVVIFHTMLDELLGKKYQGKAFLSWADKNNLVETDKSGNAKKVVKFEDKSIRAIILRTDYLDELEENGGFMQVDEDSLPFK